MDKDEAGKLLEELITDMTDSQPDAGFILLMIDDESGMSYTSNLKRPYVLEVMKSFIKRNTQ